jgi:hypothetical protein
MPFELGLAVAQNVRNRRETWYVCETVPHRIGKSLSDLNGTDVRIHGGTVEGVFGALCECLCAKNSAAFCSGNVSHLPRPETESTHDNESSWRQRPIRRTSFSRSDLRRKSTTACIFGEELRATDLSCWFNPVSETRWRERTVKRESLRTRDCRR